MLQVKEFLEIQYTTKSNENAINDNKKVYLKLPYILAFSNATKHICDKYCKSINITVALFYH